MNAFRTAALLALALPAVCQSTLVVVTKDGQRHSFPLADLARIEFGSTAPPPPPPPPPPHGNWVDAFTGGKIIGGEARQGSKVWPCKIKITRYTRTTGAIMGELTWLSLNSVHRIQGYLIDSKLTFTETDAIHPGSAHLGSAYTMTVGSNGAKGTWHDPVDRSDGDITLFAQ